MGIKPLKSNFKATVQENKKFKELINEQRKVIKKLRAERIQNQKEILKF